jgi:hypothetical protein
MTGASAHNAAMPAAPPPLKVRVDLGRHMTYLQLAYASSLQVVSHRGGLRTSSYNTYAQDPLERRAPVHSHR